MKILKTIIIIMITLIVFPAMAQKKEKIKGNKEVVEVFKNIDAFNEIEINDGFEVSLMQTGSNGFSLKTDSNLVDVIKFEVVDSILKIYQIKRITSSKKLEISVTFDNIEKLTLRQGSKIEGQNKFLLDTLILKVFDGSDFELDINSKKTTMNINDNSKGNLQLKSYESIITLNDNAYLKGSLSIEDLKMIINKKADINIEGNADQLNLITTGSTDIKAKNLKVTNASLNASNSSDIYLYVSKELSIYAKGKSYIYVYGTPHITVEGLNDKSQIIKK